MAAGLDERSTNERVAGPAHGGQTIVFVRDDDVAEMTQPLRDVAELLFHAKIPVNYQVIPQRFTAEAAEFMLGLRDRSPDLIRLNQHGFRHEQTIGAEHRWSEFAGGRPYAEQEADIREGRRILEERLGDAFDSEVFTPPCHKYDGNTLRALDAAGFSILSASVFSSSHARFFYGLGYWLGRVNLLGRAVSYHGRLESAGPLREVSVAIDVDCEGGDGDEPKLKQLVDLQREFVRERAHHRIVGVMLHHHRYDEAGKLETLANFIRWLQDDASVEFRSIEQIASDPAILG